MRNCYLLSSFNLRGILQDMENDGNDDVNKRKFAKDSISLISYFAKINKTKVY